MIQLDDVPPLSYKSNEYITLFHHHDFNNNSDFTRKAKNLDTYIPRMYTDIWKSSKCIL